MEKIGTIDNINIYHDENQNDGQFLIGRSGGKNDGQFLIGRSGGKNDINFIVGNSKKLDIYKLILLKYKENERNNTR